MSAQTLAEQYRDNGLPEHALAFIELLERSIRDVRAGEAVHDVADRIELTIRIAARRI